MKALYSRAELNRNPFENGQMQEPLQRYLYKFENERVKIRKLKHHEKDYLFQAMKCLYDCGGDKKYNIFRIPEAREYLFDWIILIHSNMFMVFDGIIPLAKGQCMSTLEKRKNKRFFYEYLQVWKNQIESGKDPYFSEIRPAIHRKIEDWRRIAMHGNITLEKLKQKEIYVYACFFHVYYRVKTYFDELPAPYVIQQINGFDVVFNVYSYIHIYSRHYIPNMNYEIGLSTNSEIASIDLDELPISVLALLAKYSESCPLTLNTEYCLFKQNDDKYILWLKYKELKETKANGFEVRSFYKCLQEHDLIKFDMGNAHMLLIE